MKNNEPECVVLKRHGEKHVAELLAGKTRKEVLNFWSKRTHQLQARQEKHLLKKKTV